MVEALIWVGVVFTAGSLLILERRCLGQMAIVQPLVLCLAAGLITGQQDTGIWLGVTLQLFSVARVRQVDWALCGIVSATALFCLERLGIGVVLGGPGAIVLTAISVIIGVGSKALDKRYARTDGERLRAHSPFAEPDPAQAIELSVRRASYRWIVVGGLEVIIGAGLAILSVVGTGFLPSKLWATGTQIFSAFVPVLGVAVAVASLAKPLR